jgi:serine protease Do
MKVVGRLAGPKNGRVKAWVVVAALLATVHPRRALAEGGTATKKVSVGFSNLVARVDDDQISFANPEYRVHVLEALRSAGFNALGAESLVFNKDSGERASLMLGGTVRELSCVELYSQLRCRVGIEWELLDREQDRIVYRVVSRYAGLNLPHANIAAAGKQLTLGALGSLMKRKRFIEILSETRETTPEEIEYQPASFASCKAPNRPLPADFEAIAAGTVIVRSGDGTGSGFDLTSDGLILTAAHVIGAGKLEVQTRDGSKLPASVVRISRKHDVALLSLGPQPSERPCLVLDSTPQATGADVFAIGSPGGAELGFSLSRGIVSGLRTIGEVPLVQTDASLSPGNSGGPLVSQQGKVVGVVSRKIAGHAVEGLGFAIPIQAGLTALKLEPGNETSASLHRAPASPPVPSQPNTVDDTSDAMPSLDPDGDRQRADAQADRARLLELRANTPGYIKPMRFGGLVLGSVGALVGIYTGLQPTDDIKRSDFEKRRLVNELGWGAAVVGFGAFIASYPLAPKLRSARIECPRSWSLAAGPAQVQLHVRFE